MYLKRLESKGFKSFAERISVDFVSGVTAVVGPNGSGKSNITDAIRWVLGEQSAKSLRGSKMEDIIFQGSDTRKALNVAEVTLVLDNQDQRVPLDYEEVSVTRRVYRSGESEFYINKQPCRLKDIIDLFMDSGLGREAFSIISQGKVEEILSSKAEERRTIFEEAAGVLKYKQRKKKAEYKLAETQENLNRVEDIIYEIEQQIDPMEEQADRAKRYQQLQEQLRDTEVALLITEIERIHSDWQIVLQDLESEKDNQVKQQQQVKTIENRLFEQKQVSSTIDESLEKLQSTLLQSTEQLEKYEGRKQLLDERSKHFGENREKLTQQLQEIEQQIVVLANDLKTEQSKLTDIQQSKKQTKDNVELLQQKLSTSQEKIADQIEDLKSEYIELLNQQAAKRNELQSVSQQTEQIEQKNKHQSSKFKDLIAKREQLQSEKEEVEKVLETIDTDLKAKEKEMMTLKLELQSERGNYEDAQSKLYQGYQYIEKLKSKKEMLEEMKEDYQGFFHGVKSILKAREDKKLTGIEGAVIELMEVPKQYVTAMETVLGGQAQHIVVMDDQAARKAIGWLKQTNNGRATFLPLASIQERFIANEWLGKIRKHEGFVGVAAELIKIDDKYKKVLSHLMGHVIITKTLKDANEIAKQVQRRYRIVTLEGDVVNPGGSMSGGAQKKSNQSLFTREKDLQDIAERLEEYQQKAQQFEHTVKKRKELVQQLDNKLSEGDKDKSSLQERLQSQRNTMNELDIKLTSVNDNLSIYDMDKQQYAQDVDQLSSRKNKLTNELESIKQQLIKIQSEIDKLTEEESLWKENQEKLQDEYHHLQVLLAEQEERLKHQQLKTKELQDQYAEAIERKDDQVAELINLDEIHATDESEEQIDEIIAINRKKKQEASTKIAEQREKRMQQVQYLDQLDEQLKKENQQLEEINERKQQSEVKSNRLDVELENRLSQLEKDYTTTYERACEEFDKVENIQQTQVEVDQLKADIERLGTVNLGAIEEFERISERYNFLSEQKNDLVEGKQTLYSVISEMDTEMKNRFEETFNNIKEEFATVFVHLFGGGHAELKLTDPANLLETGIDIIAQPPGKKLQHLGLLSGGERALTAIALLFAILRVRPVPFCILDEVEAALDEANVARFAKYVKQYSKETQFIVITHRKGTMEEADVLYGVTMQESGVSRLVSVRLEDTKELISS
ncbi:chromosome segregation protein SMC [Oceanobacillus kimchii]|uniref:chromosome segregation protein SMC n=1 Tax=Oceanobacillus kimchii TaxID=746691 RepID=UPI000346A0E7|nr:chromosome segregation protein SMC [Oceanobacillus kimchii]